MESREQIILNVCVLLARKAELRVSMREPSQVAGIMGGRFGLFSGAALAGVMPMGSSTKNAADIIKYDLTDQQKHMLVTSVEHFFEDIALIDAESGLRVLSHTAEARYQMKQTLIQFLKKELNLHIWSSKTIF
ncbi:uncharacterized protein isoform X1 [Leptinotarsa decemlineata]|uniref:uncharacterized protein isoform X1 n=1 Tax=Leptinotarsa decemlineata TaxID=7539 RepID=UPI003D307138